LHGFSDEKALSWLIGRELQQLGIGQHELVLNFFPEGRMMVAGAWELVDPAGQIVDHSMEHGQRTEYRLHHLIGPSVAAVAVDSAEAATVTFGNGFRLRLLDDDPRYEAIVMEPGDGVIVVV